LFFDKSFKEKILTILIVSSAFTFGLGVTLLIKNRLSDLSNTVYLQMVAFLTTVFLAKKVISNSFHRKVFLMVSLATLLGGFPTLTLLPLCFLFYLTGSGEVIPGSFLSFISQNIDLTNYYSFNNILIILSLSLLPTSIYSFFILVLFKVVSSWNKVEKIGFPTISVILQNDENVSSQESGVSLPKVIFLLIGIFLSFLSIQFRIKNLFLDLWVIFVPVTLSYSIVFFFVLRYITISMIGSIANFEKSSIEVSYSLGAELALILMLILVLPIWEKLLHYFEEIDLEFVLPFGIVFILLLLISFIFFEFNAIYIFLFFSLISIVLALLISRAEGQYIFPLSYTLSYSTPISVSYSSVYLFSRVADYYPISLDYPGLIYSFLVLNPAIFLGSSYSIMLSKGIEEVSHILLISVITFFISLFVNYIFDLKIVHLYLSYPLLIKESVGNLLNIKFDSFYVIVFMIIFLFFGLLDITVMQVQAFPSFLNISGAYIANIINFSEFDIMIILLLSVMKHLYLRRNGSATTLKEYGRIMFFFYSTTYLILSFIFV